MSVAADDDVDGSGDSGSDDEALRCCSGEARSSSTVTAVTAVAPKLTLPHR